MIYEERRYYILPAKMGAWAKEFDEQTLPIYNRLGGRLVGSWRTELGGQHNEFIYIMAFNDATEREEFWTKCFADPEFQALRAGPPLVSHIIAKIMKPLRVSPLQ